MPVPRPAWIRPACRARLARGCPRCFTFVPRRKMKKRKAGRRAECALRVADYWLLGPFHPQLSMIIPYLRAAVKPTAFQESPRNFHVPVPKANETRGGSGATGRSFRRNRWRLLPRRPRVRSQSRRKNGRGRRDRRPDRICGTRPCRIYPPAEQNKEGVSGNPVLSDRQERFFDNSSRSLVWRGRRRFDIILRRDGQ